MNKTIEYDVYIEDLELSNIDLQKELEQAKEIIKNLLILKNDHYGNTKMEWRVEVTEQAEQFLKEEGMKTKEDVIIDKYNLPNNVTECWEVVTAYGEVAYYRTGEIEYTPYHYGPFGLFVKPMPREKVYKKILWGFDPFCE